MKESDLAQFYHHDSLLKRNKNHLFISIPVINKNLLFSNFIRV